MTIVRCQSNKLTNGCRITQSRKHLHFLCLRWVWSDSKCWCQVPQVGYHLSEKETFLWLRRSPAARSLANTSLIFLIILCSSKVLDAMRMSSRYTKQLCYIKPASTACMTHWKVAGHCKAQTAFEQTHTGHGRWWMQTSHVHAHWAPPASNPKQGRQT